jgi:hypothetical protein
MSATSEERGILRNEYENRFEKYTAPQARPRISLLIRVITLQQHAASVEKWVDTVERRELAVDKVKICTYLPCFATCDLILEDLPSKNLQDPFGVGGVSPDNKNEKGARRHQSMDGGVG